MIAPLLIFFVSVAGVAVALLRPEYSDFLLLAGPSAAASLVLLFSGCHEARPVWLVGPYWYNGPLWYVVGG